MNHQEKYLYKEAKTSNEELVDKPDVITFLPACYQPGSYDVICQRGRETFDHGKSKFLRIGLAIIETVINILLKLSRQPKIPTTHTNEF